MKALVGVLCKWSVSDLSPSCNLCTTATSVLGRKTADQGLEVNAKLSNSKCELDLSLMRLIDLWWGKTARSKSLRWDFAPSSRHIATPRRRRRLRKAHVSLKNHFWRNRRPSQREPHESATSQRAPQNARSPQSHLGRIFMFRDRLMGKCF